MLKNLLILLLCCCSSVVFAQDYSYTFQGKLTPEKQTTILKLIESSEGVEYCKIRYKEDSERGEFILIIEKTEIRSEDQESFSPTSIKAILLENELEPIEFRAIKQ